MRRAPATTESFRPADFGMLGRIWTDAPVAPLSFLASSGSMPPRVPELVVVQNLSRSRERSARQGWPQRGRYECLVSHMCPLVAKDSPGRGRRYAERRSGVRTILRLVPVGVQFRPGYRSAPRRRASAPMLAPRVLGAWATVGIAQLSARAALDSLTSGARAVLPLREPALHLPGCADDAQTMRRAVV